MAHKKAGGSSRNGRDSAAAASASRSSAARSSSPATSSCASAAPQFHPGKNIGMGSGPHALRHRRRPRRLPHDAGGAQLRLGRLHAAERRPPSDAASLRGGMAAIPPRFSGLLLDLLAYRRGHEIPRPGQDLCSQRRRRRRLRQLPAREIHRDRRARRRRRRPGRRRRGRGGATTSTRSSTTATSSISRPRAAITAWARTAAARPAGLSCSRVPVGTEILDEDREDRALRPDRRPGSASCLPARRRRRLRQRPFQDLDQPRAAPVASPAGPARSAGFGCG